MAGGRPTEYNYEILKPKIEAYLQLCQDELTEFHKTRGEKSDSYDRIVNVKIPTIEGLAVYLGINKNTIYDWESKYPEFSDDIDRLRAIQASRLIENGLAGTYNPTIAKVLLSKHGYKESTEQDLTSKGEKIMVLPSELINKNDITPKPENSSQ